MKRRNRTVVPALAAMFCLLNPLNAVLRAGQLLAQPNDNAYYRSKSKTPIETLGEKKLSQTSSSVTFEPYPSWRGGPSTGSTDPRWKVVKERNELDPMWEGKLAIDFYGIVLDEEDNPVTNAIITFVWTDLSQAGTSKQESTSDSKGMFQLKAAIGKNLGVQVTKTGYYSSHQNRNGFEYADFANDHYYEADPDNRIAFHLRKKGETVPLVFREREIKVKLNTPVAVTLDGNTQFTFVLKHNQYPNRGGSWEAQIDVVGGGLLPANEEFITKAPVDGYEATVSITANTPKPPTWQLYQGGAFYLKAGSKYGRLDIEMVPGNDWFRLRTWINPTEGSTNVEVEAKNSI